MGLTSGSRLGTYDIHSPLGAGGMGEVYRATDTKLGRDVALKVLPAEMSHDPERLARFHREARAVAALNHPNVVTLYSVEESNGVHFITMELIEGQPLDRVITAEGLSPERLIEIASAVAEALSAAHEKGIVHRDLKPANVMISREGRVKVLDFGLAKDVGAESGNLATMTSAGLTQAGMVMGTPAYMSPEQVSGRALDHRSDIFSLGVVLHEMATGQRPFEGSSSAELISSILRDHPPSVTELRPELPSDLARVIRRCLEKDPRHRMQTARDVSNEFRDLARTISRATPAPTSTARLAPKSDSGAAHTDEGFWVAVLPFKYAGSNADLSALADGLTDDIITGLSKFSYLRVIARSSSSRYAGQSVDVRTAGKELSARYVMEGTLRQAGTRLRLAVQLVDTVSGAHLWAENYERAFSPETIFDLQDDLVPRIVSTVADMNGALPRSMGEAVRNKLPEQLSPYEAVLRSFAYPQRGTPQELTAARSALEAALRKAPGYADAWAMLSFLSGQDYIHGYELQADAYESATVAARRAVELAPSNHLAYFALAQSLWYQKDYDSFRDAAERAVALNPMDGNSVAYMGELLTYTGAVERGMQLAERAKQLNPNHPGWYWCADFYQAFAAGDYRKALSFGQKSKLQSYPLSAMFIATACGHLGDVEGGAKAVTDLVKFRPELAAIMRKQVAKVWNPEYGERFLEGLRNAGMEIPEKNETRSRAVTSHVTPSSGSRAVAAREDEGFWVAVLPFKETTGEADLAALADGLTEDITTGLSRFPYLQVIAQNSAMTYKGRATDIRTVGGELGARYVIEGSIRKRGPAIRVSVQLMDALSGTQLWAEAYDREISSSTAFQIQDDLTDHIVTSVADGYGVLVRSMAAPTRYRNVEELTASELVLRHYAFMQQVNLEEHAALRAGFETILQREPNHATAWACLANLYLLEYYDRFNPRENAMERARDAAWRAVKIDPACQMGWKELAAWHFFNRDFIAFREAAERAMKLNPRDGITQAYMAIMLAFSGEWERGLALVQRTMDLNRHHPGWYHNVAFHYHYRREEYEAALLAAKKVNMPEFHWMHLAIAAASAMLGRDEEARAAIESLRKVNEAFLDLDQVREDVEKWDPNKEDVERFLLGLQKAGLKYRSTVAVPTPSEPVAAGNARADHKHSGASRADEGFWIAVLPFKCGGGNADLVALADGLTDDIVTNMAKFSYLRVIARSSTAQYAQRSVDVRTAARELGARYVMEGSIRQAGAKVRIAVQLVDAATGAGLWAEAFDRPFSAETSLDILDDVVPRIVCTVADTQGVLAHSMTDALRTRDPETLTPYEAVLRSFGHHQRINATEHLAARTALEHAVKQSPDRADCWATLAWMYREEYTHGFNLQPDPLGRALAAARRALDAGPTNHLAQAALASTLFFLHDVPSFRAAAERAIALNPLEGYTLAYLGMLIAYGGDWERGCALADRAMQLNANHPGWYWFPRAFDAYRRRDYREAIETVLKVNLPGFWRTQLMLAAANGQMGEQVAAAHAVDELLSIRPNFKDLPRNELNKWHNEEMKQHLLEGLRKAGLEIGEDRPETVQAPGASATGSGATRAGVREDEGFWVAVLPFKYGGNNGDLKALADGLSEEIITGLSRFSYLRVIARGSTAKYSTESGDVRAIGKELGARYVMEASIRQAGAAIRIAVQLVDAPTGAHLWAETYERQFRKEDVFTLQDDIVDRVVATVADASGILVRSLASAVEDKPEAELTALDWVLRAFGYRTNVTPQAHAAVREGLERFVERDPRHADVWACLAVLYLDEFAFGFNARPDALGRTLNAAQQSIKLDRSCQTGHHVLAHVHFFRKDVPAFRATAAQTIALNPRSTDALAHLAVLFVFAGDYEHGANLARRAMDWNPQHAGWYHVALVWYYFQKAEYQKGLDEETRINIPGLFWQPLAVAACCGLLGRHAEALAAAEELRQLDKDIEVHLWRHIEIYSYASGFMDRILEGLANAGLHIAIPADAAKASESQLQRPGRETPAAVSETSSPPGPNLAQTSSSQARIDEGFWVAVLPFKYTGDNRDIKALADGLSDEVITGLSRFSYLRVIARGSTAKYSNESGDVRAIGKELGARYVIEASLRQAGSKLRLAVQLADTVSGAHLWAETYERAFSPESLFELQDDLVPRIVATVADQYGVLPRSMSEALRSKREQELTAHEAVLRAFSYFTRLTADEHAIVRRILERAVREAPDHADCWAMLSMIYRGEFAQGFNVQPDSLGRALAAAQRAVDLAPTHALGHYSLATVYFFRKDKLHFRVEAERGLALNPNDAAAMAYLGLLIASAGEWERGTEMVESAMRLNPNCPGYFYFARCWGSYRLGKYEETLEAAAHINMPGYYHIPAIQAAALGQLGRHEEARKALQDLLALRPAFATTARQEYAKWYDDENVELVLDGLRKAGLEIPETDGRTSEKPAS